MKRKAKVINCKKLGIRKAPWIPEEEPEIVCLVKAGDILEINAESTVFDWTGKKFYQVETPSGAIGYAVVEALELL